MLVILNPSRFLCCIPPEGMAEVEGVIEELSERMETGEIPGLPNMSDLAFDHASGDEEGSEDGVSDEDEDDDDDDDDLMEEDPYNSAGEEVGVACNWEIFVT